MKPNDQDDPQQTLTPGQAGARRRITVTDATAEESSGGNNRRVKFGTPKGPTVTVRNDPNSPEVSASVQRGFTLGPERKTGLQAKSSSKSGVQPWILIVAGGALILLVVALLFRPASASNAEAAAQQKLITQYTKYLEAKGPTPGLDINERKKEVLVRLKAISWAKAIGDKAVLENELSGLLFLDDDKNSPLYQYSMSQMKQLGTTNRRPG
ncbi:MAG TPA: hypothetical protein VI306_00765 [Pyrinomonadaceae bacterium]